jgi:hypothetical protein
MPKKKAKKKTVVSKARVRNATSSRTTNRTTNRVAVDYTLPPGPLSKVLDAHLASFKRMGEALTNRVQYSIPSVKDDAVEMLSRIKEDLAAFKVEDTPVTLRHMEFLQLHVDELNRLGADDTLEDTSQEVVSEDLKRAQAGVVRARNRLAERAKACGVPVQLFDIRLALTSPGALHARIAVVLEASQGVLDQFDSPARARALWKELAAAAEKLGKLLAERRRGHQAKEDGRERRRLVVRSMYQFMLWLSQYGRAVFMDDPDGLIRWRLDKTFPSQGQTAEAGSPEEELASLLTPG